MSGHGTLYGVGVGPGDPELMTLKACTIIGKADVIAYPVNGSGRGMARDIAAGVIPVGVTELPVHVPMKPDRAPARAAYDKAANEIASHLKAGRSAAWLCVGDPLFYASFMYLAARLAPAHEIEIVPGVTSLSACAARTRLPLAGRNDVLSVVPATLGEEALTRALRGADAAVVIKVGRHFEKVRGVLSALGLARNAIVIEHGTGAEERVAALADMADGERPYFSTILLRREDVA